MTIVKNKGVIWGLWLAACCLVSGAGAAFLPATDDIPLMDGIALEPAEDFSFDSPAGQVLILEGKTQKSPAAVRSFYRENLTALGWTKEKNDTYHRGSDTLQLTFPDSGTVRFDITLSSDR